MGRNNRSNAVTISFAWSRPHSDNCENLGIDTTLKRAHIALQTFAVCLFPKNASMLTSRLTPSIASGPRRMPAHTCNAS